MEDFLGNIVNVGDTVVVLAAVKECGRYRRFMVGKVEEVKSSRKAVVYVHEIKQNRDVTSQTVIKA